MKRVERRGTLDSAAQAAASASLRHSQSHLQNASQASLSSIHSQSYNQSHHPYPEMQTQSSRSRAPARTDTLLLEPVERHPSDRARSGSPGPGSRYHSSAQPAASAAAARDSSLASHSQARYSQSQSHARRAPTPPNITSIPSNEQYTDSHSRHPHGVPSPSSSGQRAPNGVTGRTSRDSSAGGETDLLEDKRSHATSGYAHSYTRHTREDERDELEDDADGVVEDADAEADGSGVASTSGDTDPDAEIMDAVDATMKTED